MIVIGAILITIGVIGCVACGLLFLQNNSSALPVLYSAIGCIVSGTLLFSLGEELKNIRERVEDTLDEVKLIRKLLSRSTARDDDYIDIDE